MSKTYNVLFVDDEINVLNSIKRGLIDEDYNCLFANSGKEALEIIAKNEISVIVSDMRMSEMDGLRLLKEVTEKSPDTVKIVLSGYTQLQQILTTINQVDVFKFITKPWKMESEFKVIIRQALDYYKMLQENRKIKSSLEKQNQAYKNMFDSLSWKIKNLNRHNEILQGYMEITHSFTKQKLNCDKETLGYILDLQFQLYGLLKENIITHAEKTKTKQLINCIKKNLDQRTNFIKHIVESNGSDEKDIGADLTTWMLEGILMVVTEETDYESYLTTKQGVDGTLMIKILLLEKENIQTSQLTYDIKKEIIEKLILSIEPLNNIPVTINKKDDKVLVEIPLQQG